MFLQNMVVYTSKALRWLLEWHKYVSEGVTRHALLATYTKPQCGCLINKYNTWH